MTASRDMTDPSVLLEHAAWLRRLATSLVHDDSVADELVQDTWVAALRRPPSTDRPVRPWLARVLHNAARFRWRGERNRTAREQLTASLAEDVPSSDELLERHETQRLLARLVAELAEPYRTAILLRYAEGLAPSAIAQRFGVPAGTIRSRLSVGLARLRTELDAHHRGDRRRWMFALAPLLHRRRAAPLGAVIAFAIVAVAVVAGIVLGTRSLERPAHEAGTAPRRAPPASTRPASTRANVAATDAPAISRRVAGRVVAGGAPVPGARVRLTTELSRAGLAPPLERTTDRDGRFDFAGVPIDEVALGAALPGTLAAIAHVDLRDPTTRADDLVLALEDCSTGVYGVIADAAGTPIADADVLREDVIGTRSDASGAYDLCMLSVGPSIEHLRLVIRARGYGAMTFDVGLNGRQRLDVTLTPEVTLTGRASRDDGTPVASARLWIERADREQRRLTEQPARAIAVTGADGRFQVTGLAAGRYRISGGAPGTTATPTEVALVPEDPVDVAVPMVPAARVAGRIVRAGVPVAGATVAFAGHDERARSQPDGSFVLERAPLGTHEITAAPYRVRASARITVGTTTGELLLEVEPLGRVEGIVRRHGASVSGARVCAKREPNGGECAMSDASGGYALEGLDPGAYTVTAESFLAGAATIDVPIAIVATHALDLDLTTDARVTGIVVDRAGDPVEGAHVRFLAPDFTQSRCVSRATGAFDCGSMNRAWTYDVDVFSAPDFAISIATPKPAPITFPGGASRIADLRFVVDTQRLDIRGTVVDAAGAPIADARIAPWTNGVEPAWLVAMPRSATDRDGRFRIANLARGTYTLAIETPDGMVTLIQNVAAGRSDVRAVIDPVLCRDPGRAQAADPTRTAISDTEPTGITARPDHPVIWDRRLELVGWSLPPTVARGTVAEMTLFFRVLAPIDAPWLVFAHFDGATLRVARGDHAPVDGRCPTTTWRPGTYIADRFPIRFDAPASARGTYDVWIGFFTGWAPNWTNMPISEAPAARVDGYGRVKITQVELD